MPVPEAAMNEDDLPARGKDDVWATGEVSPVEPVSIAELVEKSADGPLRSRILTPDPPHVLAALVWCEPIHCFPWVPKLHP